MEKLTFKVNEYEGPLDLILALLSKHQIEICDINISDLLEQYMACIRTLQEHQMEVASEFLEMASRLVYIKTASLLPREEKEEDPRAELVGQLLEYQSCKQAAALLRLRDSGWAVFTRSPLPLEIDPTYRRRHPCGELAAAYWSACGRGRRRLPPQETAFTPLVTKPVVSAPAAPLLPPRHPDPAEHLGGYPGPQRAGRHLYGGAGAAEGRTGPAGRGGYRPRLYRAGPKN